MRRILIDHAVAACARERRGRSRPAAGAGAAAASGAVGLDRVLRRAQCRRRPRLDPQRLHHRGIRASDLQYVARRRRRGRAGGLRLADGPMGARARSELRRERAQRRPHGALPAAFLRRVRGALFAEALLVRDATAEDRLRARQLALLRHRRRRPRPGRHDRERHIRGFHRHRQSQPDAGRLDAGRRRRSRARRGLERQDRISLSRSGQPHDDLSPDPADLEHVASQRQCDHRRRQLPLLMATQARLANAPLIKALAPAHRSPARIAAQAFALFTSPESAM